MVIDDRVARRRPGERRLGDSAAGEGVEQRGLADTGAAHEHDDQEGAVHVEGVGLTAQVADQPFEGGVVEGRQRVTMAAVEPGAQAAFQAAQGWRQRSQQGSRIWHGHPLECDAVRAFKVGAASRAAPAGSGSARRTYFRTSVNRRVLRRALRTWPAPCSAVLAARAECGAGPVAAARTPSRQSRARP